jgi:hypothetical protein
VPGVTLDAARVEEDFASPLLERGECVWVGEEKVRALESGGYRFFPHPEGPAMCFRILTLEPRAVMEFLMVPPARSGDV